MRMTRNKYFLFGTVLILLGIQFRMVNSFVLNEPTTRTLAKVTKSQPAMTSSSLTSMVMQVHPKPTKQVAPPRWLGLAMITLGTVMSLHAVALPKS